MKTLCTIHAIAQRPDGKILLLQRTDERDRPRKWNCVTGYIKEKEPAEEAALRELKEETSLEGVIIRTSEPHFIEHDDTRWIIVPSLISVENIEHMKVDEHESQNHQWVAPNDPMIDSMTSLKASLGKLGMR
ncbi:MAG: NUDIX hydrolase [Parcubacteria group bacterium]